MTTRNPDLLNPGATVANSVHPMVALTKPLGNTKAEEPVYYRCSMATASFHRPDGKKLPFLNHVFKTQFIEDIVYLNNEIENGNPYIKHATLEEVEQAKLQEDPMGTVRAAIKNELSIEELEELLAKRRAVAATREQEDANKIAGVDKNPNASGPVKAQDVRTNIGAVSAASLAHMLKTSGK